MPVRASSVGLESPGRRVEDPDVYTPTTLSNPSARAQGLSEELSAVLRERRAQDPTLGLPDVLVATEVIRASLLSESGITAARSRIVAVVAALLLSGSTASPSSGRVAGRRTGSGSLPGSVW